MGPGPPPRRARRTNTGSTRPVTAAGRTSTAVSQVGSSIDVIRGEEEVRLSDDTLDDDNNWNRKRYQREDEELWGCQDATVPTQHTMPGSSIGVAGLTRPGTSRSGSHYSVRAPPVNDLHPPVVSILSPDPADNRWMLQPPPKASVMNGKERATNRSRSGSGASSRVELSLQRQVSSRQLRYKLERGETPEVPSLSRGNSYSNVVVGHRHDRPHTPQTRPLSAASSRTKKRRRDTAMTRTDTIERSSGDSSDTIIKRRSPSPKPHPLPGISVVRVRTSRQQLSTVMSSGSGNPDSPTPLNPTSTTENQLSDMPSKAAQRRIQYSSAQSSDSIPYFSKHRKPFVPSDISSLNVLQDLVSPHALLSSRFVSAPLMEARIKLPPSDHDEEKHLDADPWAGSGFAISRSWGTDQMDGDARVPFDSLGVPERDPRMRWSVDF
jgi:hypothetical protein